MATITPLPPYPSTQARKSLSASQLTHFHLNIARALGDIISLPPAKCDTPTTRAFVSTYAADAAHQVLQGLIWGSPESPRFDENVYPRVLILAEKLASSPPGLDLCTVLDLCVAFTERSARVKNILAAALTGTPSLPSTFVNEVVPAFTVHLSPSRSSGLYALRKTAHCLLNFLRPCPSELVRPFAHSKDFVVALGRAYDEGLSSMARSYGGIRNLDDSSRTLDDWERVWIETKVALVDAFHIIMKCLVEDISAASGHQLSVEMEDRVFGIVNALVEIDSRTRQFTAGDGRLPFLNSSLISDYQYAYDLNRMLFSVLHDASREDARAQSLDTALRALRVDSSTPSGTRDPGALKLILQTPQHPRKESKTSPSKGEQKARERSPSLPVIPSAAQNPDIDIKVVQVLDIFPDVSADYIRKLLEHPSYPFRGSAERVIEALLEGTAPEMAELETDTTQSFSEPVRVVSDTERIERRNVFDDEVMDVSRLHRGKKKHDEDIFLQSKSERERMKTDVLRRIQIMVADEDDEDQGNEEVAYMDDLDGFGDTRVKVTGDGEDTSDEDGERGNEAISPETILELAYIRDPRLFARDAETRRSKDRAELKAQTGWADEQIEGWKIMLERNPRKDHILQKHEFQGNRIAEMQPAGSASNERRPPSGASGHPRGRGGSARARGSDRGRGRGRGRGRSEGGSGDGSANEGAGERGSGDRGDGSRSRALKDRHKASSANHNRKRGHDKKMARTGFGPSG
ncbi:hypothetical protein EDD15DRAFT_492519 [Pisolithus albus]|nr:hypothetical protein EDD15DRAFT_492519 [Pisolithus albus]